MNQVAPTSLSELAVSNLGLIESARLEPGRGLVVVTGETGAGKSLLLGALRLLRGEPGRKDQIGRYAAETTVSGRFTAGGDETVLERRIGPSGSKGYVDGGMAPARTLKERSDGVIDIVGQHDRLRLADRSAVRILVDGAMDSAGRDARDAYTLAWDRLTEARRRIALLGGDRRALERELDMLRFQVAEISDAAFAEGDDVRLETEARRLRNAETLGEHLAAAARESGEEGATAGLDAAVRELRVAARTDPSLEALVEQSAEVTALLGDLSAEIARTASTMERDPEALAGVENRLALLGDLRRKYGDTLDDVLAFRAGAETRMSELDDLLGRAGHLEQEEQDAAAGVVRAGEALRAARVESAKKLAESARFHLADLGFTEPVVRFDLEADEPGPNGADRITLLFASNAALQPGPVGRIASGGELSRLVLVLRLAGSAGEADIVAFDEIDAGVGGATALAMGRKLAALAESRQVLCVTHLPQVAAFAETHVVVTRDANRVVVRVVDGTERIEELSRMLAGLPDSERGREHAEELLALAAGR